MVSVWLTMCIKFCALTPSLYSYLINYEYSKDLNINSMGRRIRTRLYFTSESHLHTVLNVFRFALMGNGKRNLLSQHGHAILNSSPELCYLTQVVLRVFEDNRRPIEDPRRFRIEILFSPGATATPMHMNELDREQDQSRFDTAPLQLISREGLTCQEVEGFFEHAIMAGRSDEESYEIASTSTAAERSKKPKKKKPKNKKQPEKTEQAGTTDDALSSQGGFPESEPLAPGATGPSNSDEVRSMPPAVVETDSPPNVEDLSVAPDLPESEPDGYDVDHLDNTDIQSKQEDISAHDTVRAKNDRQYKSPGNLSDIFPTSVLAQNKPETKFGGDGASGHKCDREPVEPNPKITENGDEKRTENRLSRKYLWGTVAVASFGFGITCFVMALTMSDGRRARRWSTRRSY